MLRAAEYLYVYVYVSKCKFVGVYRQREELRSCPVGWNDYDVKVQRLVLRTFMAKINELNMGGL